jgi:hypothetical protein
MIEHQLTGRTERRRVHAYEDRFKEMAEAICGAWVSITGNEGKPCERCAKAAATDAPPHYTAGTQQTIDHIREVLGPEGFRAYAHGSAMKYIARAGKKGDFAEDMRKAANFCNWAAGIDWREKEED